MRILDALMRNEPIAGLDISDTHVRFVFLEKVRGGPARIVSLVEEPLPKGVVITGTVAKPEALIDALRAVRERVAKRVRHVILSLPPHHVYANVFTFPPTIQGKKLAETMRLTLGFQLPMKPEEAYLDWQTIETDDEHNAVLLAAIPRPVIDAYREALRGVGLSPVAIEFHPLSFARTIKLPDDGVVLVTATDETGVAIYVLHKGAVLFMRILPELYHDEKRLTDELRRITDFVEAAHAPVTQTIRLEEAKIVEPFGDHPDVQQDEYRWLISIGAALRGTLPRADDKIISLMPVGTEQAYEYQKATTFASLAANLILGLSVFFAAAFLGVWFFMTSFQQQTLQRIENVNIPPIPEDAQTITARAETLNALIGTTAALTETFTAWSAVLDEIQSQVPQGIQITNFSFRGAKEVLTMTGIAGTRSDISTLISRLKASPLFTAVSSPVSSLEQTSDVPFSVSFRLNPGS